MGGVAAWACVYSSMVGKEAGAWFRVCMEVSVALCSGVSVSEVPMASTLRNLVVG